MIPVSVRKSSTAQFLASRFESREGNKDQLLCLLRFAMGRSLVQKISTACVCVCVWLINFKNEAAYARVRL